MINQKEKTYASFILYYDENIFFNSQQFNQLELWISSYFEYFEIIIVNNSSLSQNTLKQNLMPILKDIIVIDLGGIHLRDHALRAGIEFSKGDSIFIITDMHISDITSQLQLIYEKHKVGNDIVVLNSPYSKLRHTVLLKLIAKLTHKSIPLNYDFIFIISKRVLNYYTQINSYILPLTILLKDSGYNIIQIEYKTNKTILLSKDEYTIYLMVFSDTLPKAIFFLSGGCFTISILGTIYALSLYILKKDIVEGWTTLFLLSSFGFSGIFLILSLITRYLGLFGKEILDKPIYKIKQIKKL